MQAVKVFLLGLLSKEDSHVTLTAPAVSPALWLRETNSQGLLSPVEENGAAWPLKGRAPQPLP